MSTRFVRQLGSYGAESEQLVEAALEIAVRHKINIALAAKQTGSRLIPEANKGSDRKSRKNADGNLVNFADSETILV